MATSFQNNTGQKQCLKKSKIQRLYPGNAKLSEILYPGNIKLGIPCSWIPELSNHMEIMDVKMNRQEKQYGTRTTKNKMDDEHVSAARIFSSPQPFIAW